MEQTLGARLRSQRERQEIALATIAEETKINVTLLEGLERDDLSRWPGGLFRRAYVRTYAQKIGLDPDQVLREFLALYPDAVEATSAVEALAQNAEAKRPRTRIGLMLAGLGRRRQRHNGHRSVSDSVAIEDHTPIVRADAPVRDAAPSLLVEPQPAAIAETPAERVDLEPPTSNLVVVPPAEPQVERRRDVRILERAVAATARLCTRLGCARDDRDLSSALSETVDTLVAQGAILWVWDSERDVLFPGVAHGYSAELLSRLPEVDREADNAISAAFCCGQKQVVRGTSDSTGALVTPLLTVDGCAGVLALEFTNGGEQHDLVQSLATLVTAQLATLFSPASHSTIEENDGWAQQDRSLVAS